jgi:hypothetical protein
LRYKGDRNDGAVSVTLTAHYAPPPQLLISDPLAPLDLASDDGLSLPDLVLLLLLFLLVTSSDVEPYPVALVPRRCSPSSSAAHRLGPAIESHDPSARSLPDGGGVVGESTEQPFIAWTLQIRRRLGA